MLHGDISNQVANTIAIQCMGTLLEYKDHTFTDKILNTLVGKEKRIKLNESVVAMMNYIYRNTDMTIDLVIFEKDYSKKLEEYLLNECPFNRLLLVKKPSQIGSRLLTGELSFYVDDNVETRSLVNSIYAVPFKDVSQIIRKKRGR